MKIITPHPVYFNSHGDNFFSNILIYVKLFSFTNRKPLLNLQNKKTGEFFQYFVIIYDKNQLFKEAKY